MVIAVDFDGTCVTNAYPIVGENIGAEGVLQEIAEAGHQLILYTLRDGKRLDDAEKWFKRHKIPLYGINKNPKQNWTKSPKVHADLYIDDLAVGCPVRYCEESGALVVDWDKVKALLINYGVL